MIHVVVTCEQAQGLEFKSYTAKKKKGKKRKHNKAKGHTHNSFHYRKE
jgi:hypothetical protein